MRKYITLKQLREAGASASTLKTFKKLFGSRMYVSEKRVLEAVEAGLNVDWAARHLLSALTLDKYYRSTDYERIVAVTFARLYREG